jgi:cobalt-zinc-cadmium efflux system protein
VSADADRRWLSSALVLIVGYMVVEVIIGVLAHSLALISDAAHMLTDAAAIALAMLAQRLAARPPAGGYTFGLRRAEILSAQANGITLLLLAGWLAVQAAHRLIAPPDVAGGLVLVTALAGVVVNLIASWLIHQADRRSLNVEGAFQHILTDLFAFIATAIAGAVMVGTGFDRADGIATLVVVGLLIRAGLRLVAESARIFLEAAPANVDPAELGARLATLPAVVELHDLHVWQITSGEPAASAHVLVDQGSDCHALRVDLERVLRDDYGITHTTLQMDHSPSPGATDSDATHCEAPHGPTHRATRTAGGDP